MRPAKRENLGLLLVAKPKQSRTESWTPSSWRVDFKHADEILINDIFSHVLVG